MKSREKIDFSRLPLEVNGWIPYRVVRRRIEIDADEVRVTDRGMLPARPISEPLSAFAGVRRGARMRHGIPVFSVALVHGKTGAGYPLFHSNDETAARAVWLDIARVTGLPTIDVSPVGAVTRDRSAPEQPFRHLAKAGELAVPPAAPPGPSWLLRWQGEDESNARPRWPEGTTDVSVPVVGPGILLAFMILIGLSGFMCVHSLPGGMVEMLQAVRVLYCVQAALLLAILLLMLGERRHIAVTRGAVILCSTWFGRRRRGGVTLQLDAVDTVIHPARWIPLGAGSMLIVAAGPAGFTVADLSARQARWLGRFVMAAAAGEDWVYDAPGRQKGSPESPRALLA